MWKDIKGFEGQYQMSDKREVKRLPFSIKQKASTGKEYVRSFKEKIMKQNIDYEGYYYVNLNRDRYRIHWLYYNTFIGDSTGYIVDHKDRNKLNNDPSNLRLVDAKLSAYNRTLPYKPDITDFSKYKKYKNKENGKTFMLRFQEDGKRKTIGYFRTYEEAENKYRELYEERQKKIDDCSEILTINI